MFVEQREEADMWCSPDGVQWRLAVSATMRY
jgi:hypothetical protein